MTAREIGCVEDIIAQAKQYPTLTLRPGDVQSLESLIAALRLRPQEVVKVRDGLYEAPRSNSIFAAHDETPRESDHRRSTEQGVAALPIDGANTQATAMRQLSGDEPGRTLSSAQEETPDLIASVEKLRDKLRMAGDAAWTHYPEILDRVLSALRGSPPAPAERAAIVQVLQRLEAYGLPAPTMCLENNGEIGLDWHERRAASLSLNVSDDGYVGWSVLIDDWSTFGRWRVDEWPDELDKLLKRFAQDAKAQPVARTGAPTCAKVPPFDTTPQGWVMSPCVLPSGHTDECAYRYRRLPARVK